MRPKTIKLPENIGNNFFDIGHRNIFLDLSPQQGKQKQKYIIGTTSKQQAFAEQRKLSTKQKEPTE